MLWVLADNVRARAFYEHHGWLADGEEKLFEMGGERYPEVRYRRSLCLTSSAARTAFTGRVPRGGPELPGGRPASKARDAHTGSRTGEVPRPCSGRSPALVRRPAKRRPLRKKAAAPAPRYLTARRVATYPVTNSPATPTRTRSTGQLIGVVQATREDRRRGDPDPAVASGRQVGVLPRRPHHQHAACEKHRNHTICSNMTRFNIRVAFAMTSAGVGTTSLPATDLPAVAPFTKLRR